MFQRMQVVDIDTVISQETPLYTGALKGTTLGPLLFVVFYNDLKSFSMPMTPALFFSHKDLHVITQSLKADLENISKFNRIDTLT